VAPPKGSKRRRSGVKAGRIGRSQDTSKSQKKGLRRFNFAGLPALTREQIRITNRLMDFLPQSPFEKDFKAKLRATLEPLVQADVDFWFNNIAHVDEKKMPGHLASPTCVVRVGLLPHEEDMLVEIDLMIAQRCINRILGGSEHTDNNRALSDIEEGVFGFVLLKVLQQLQNDFGKEESLVLKLKGMHGDSSDALASTARSPKWTCLSFKIFFDLYVGFARVYIPTSFVDRQLIVARPAPGPALSRAMQALLERENRIASIDTALGVELGRITFTPDDINALDVGDIVLLDQPKVVINNDVVEGAVECRIGHGHAGYILGALSLGEANRYEVAIENIINSGTPKAEGSFSPSESSEPEHALAHPNVDQKRNAANAAAMNASFAPGRPEVMQTDRDAICELEAEHSEGEEMNSEYKEELYDEQEGGEFEAEEPLPESVGLLGDVNVAMVIELGRVQVTAADVLNIRPGQVIELTRSPGDPVDLVVDGKRVGRGELVEIEGELGVRILDLIR